MQTKLFRSQTDKMVAGVCGGLAKYLQIDATIVRLFFVAFTVLGGFGVLAYIILWIVLPLEEQDVIDGQVQPLDKEEFKERAERAKDEFVQAVREPNKNTARFIGIGLILAGGFIFLKQLNIPWLNWLDAKAIWAGLIVLAGVVLLVRAVRKD